MPKAAPRPCTEPGCPELTTTGRCEAHAREHTRDRTRRRYNSSNQDRKEHDAFYKSQSWRRLSKWHRKKHPLCERCKDMGVVKVGDVVDHIIERVDDDSLRLDPDNLMTLCHYHHGEKTAEARRARRISPWK